jgi:hypothetical protein
MASETSVLSASSTPMCTPLCTCQYPEQILSKYWYLSMNTHGVLSHKTVNFIVTLVSPLYKRVSFCIFQYLATDSGILTLWKSKWIWAVSIQFLSPKNIFSPTIKTNFKKCLEEIVNACFGKLRKHKNNSAVFVGVFANLQKVTFGSIIYSLSFCLFVCSSAWNNSADTGRIFINYIFENFSEIRWENSIFIQIWQE